MDKRKRDKEVEANKNKGGTGAGLLRGNKRTNLLKNKKNVKNPLSMSKDVNYPNNLTKKTLISKKEDKSKEFVGMSLIKHKNYRTISKNKSSLMRRRENTR